MFYLVKSPDMTVTDFLQEVWTRMKSALVYTILCIFLMTASGGGAVASTKIQNDPPYIDVSFVLVWFETQA